MAQIQIQIIIAYCLKKALTSITNINYDVIRIKKFGHLENRFYVVRLEKGVRI